MPIKHAKTSGKADTADGTLVQPSDWNDPHILGSVGDVITVGAASFIINGSSLTAPTVFPVGGGHIGNASRISIGEYEIPVDVDALKAALLPSAGYTFALRGHLSVRTKGALTSGYQWDCGQSGNAIAVYLGDASWNFVNPNVECFIDVVILAAVISG